MNLTWSTGLTFVLDHLQTAKLLLEHGGSDLLMAKSKV